MSIEGNESFWWTVGRRGQSVSTKSYPGEKGYQGNFGKEGGILKTLGCT